MAAAAGAYKALQLAWKAAQATASQEKDSARRGSHQLVLHAQIATQLHRLGYARQKRVRSELHHAPAEGCRLQLATHPGRIEDRHLGAAPKPPGRG